MDLGRSEGIVWIETDISNSSQNRSDRGYDGIGNNALLAAVPETGEMRRFLTGPRGCEITGITMTPISAPCSSTFSTPASRRRSGTTSSALPAPTTLRR